MCCFFCDDLLQVSFVGMTEEQARAKAEEEGFEVDVKKTSYKVRRCKLDPGLKAHGFKGSN